jgi:2-polyprenyl-3-methyl-5-hydroxy-6-metoxy-1,4-benzoquinol methylase
MVQETVDKKTGCGVCGSMTARELYTAPDRLGNSNAVFAIAECGGCGVLRTLPEMTESELAAFYPDDYWGSAAEPTDAWIKSSQSEKTRFLDKCASGGGKILDVGCGSGFFLRALDGKKWDRFGVEIGKAASEQAGRALGFDHVFNGTLIDAGLKASSFDVVTLWSALEHTNQPRANLVETRRLLREEGTLIVQVPNAASYQARIFGGAWSALDAPRHRYHFTEHTLAALLSETGFKVTRRTLFSKSHNAHALRQSLKAKMYRGFGRVPFLLTIPLIKPFDLAMTALGRGATLTVAASAA